MGGFLVRLLAGAYALSFVSTLPPLPVLLLILAVAVVYAMAWRTNSAVSLIGFAWMGIATSVALADRLDPAYAGETVSIDVEIVGFPESEGPDHRVLVSPLDNSQLPERIRLTWRDAPSAPVIGEHWRFDARLKRPRSYVNPAGFDYALWLFRERIGATGFVVNGQRLLTRSDSRVVRGRRHVVARIEALLPADETGAVLMALSVGARHRISRAWWDRFATTGTSHLMAISGLHIGLAAACIFLITRLFTALLFRRGNHYDMAAIPAAAAAFIYATLTGFGIPAQRACLMIALTAWYLWRRHRPPMLSVLVISAGVIFLTNPLALLAPGFQLSFAAVAVLATASMYFTRTAASGAPRIVARAVSAGMRLGKLQLFLLLGLFPLTVLQFGRYAVLAPAINILVLPIFSIGVVPLALAGALLDGWATPFGDLLLRAAYHLLRLVLQWLDVAATMPFPQQTAALTPPLIMLAFVSTFYVFLPPGWPARKISLLALLVVASWRPPAPANACINYTVLDVGQGLAIFVRTANHALLFDTGPAFPGGASTASLVVEPFLERHGIERVDMLIVSHSDNDHAGGATEIAAQFSPANIISGDPSGIAVPANRCVAGQSWHWDDVHFEILHPLPAARWHGNNVSCVLRVSAGAHRLLIAGDIESPVERLLAMRDADLASDIVIVPHHGSGTSSSQVFVAATGATTAIVSTGFANRWAFPIPAVVERWSDAGAVILNTATSGAISQQLCANHNPGPMQQERTVTRRFWRDSLPDAPGESRSPDR